MIGEAVCQASPSLALIKYWGKQDSRENLPATPSLAVTLEGIKTETTVTPSANFDRIWIDGKLQDLSGFAPFFQRLRSYLNTDTCFSAVSNNSFPSSAGLASSSSGFAALTYACVRAAGADLDPADLSDLARTGSASAARSVYGGFVLLPAGARRAEPLYAPDHWPQLRILIAVVSRSEKTTSSRKAMEHVRETSPYYDSWIESSLALTDKAIAALGKRDLEQLGEVMRLSYMRMHASMMAASPPHLYWLPSTVAVIRECDRLRAEGVGAWETMDAGPQVKILCSSADASFIAKRIAAVDPGIEIIETRPGPGPICRVKREEL